ncbi:phage tail fiber protein, partial [Candidatus Termititenax persephonae]
MFMANNYTDANDADFTTGNYNIAREKPLSAAGVRNALHTKENVANKQVSSTNDTADVLDASSSDSYYPSSKLAGKNFAALRSGKQDKIAAGTANDIVAYSGTTAGTFGTLPRVTTLETNTTSASDEKIPTEKAVATALSGKTQDGDALHKAGSETITGVKTFGTAAEAAEPLLGKAKTDDATNSGVKFATEAQVYKAVQEIIQTIQSTMQSIDILPAGTILAVSTGSWANAEAAFKNKWKVCDGTGGTPDLRYKFLRGGTTSDPATGDGKKILSINEMPNHTHRHTHDTHTGHFKLYDALVSPVAIVDPTT